MPSCQECKCAPCSDDCKSWHNLHAAVLCIGLGKYTEVSRLPNAIKDARELHAQANAVPGCRAELLEDLTDSTALADRIQDFLGREGLKETPPKLVCIIYNGHGMQRGATVYLLLYSAAYCRTSTILCPCA